MKHAAIHFSTTDTLTVSPTEDTLYTILYDGTDRGQKSLTVTLAVPNVVCKIYCGYKVSAGNNVDLSTTVIHKAPATSCDTVIRGVLFDGGVSSYVGKVIVERVAKGSTTLLETRVLIVGDGVHNHVEPVMQIETNDVIASHASTTGRVDENQLYYLQSRGLSREEAQTLLIGAFLSYREY